MYRFVCISDTHTYHDRISLPEGDVLIHSGDFSFTGTAIEINCFNEWLGTLNYKHKIIISGNHDLMFETNPNLARSLITNATYLQDSEFILDSGLRVWGSPWQPEFCNWAFNLPRGIDLRKKWDLIPKGIDILVTHGPPFSIGDRLSPQVIGDFYEDGEHIGCDQLMEVVKIVKPKYHVFGHIHEGYGEYDKHGTHFINASTCTEMYNPVNKPIVFDL